MTNFKCVNCDGDFKDTGDKVTMVCQETYKMFSAKVLRCISCGYEVRMEIDEECDE